MTVVSFPEFNPLSMTVNTSYVVAENHSLSSDCQILEGITLYFTTGTIQGASGIKLIGKNTQIIAPIRHIFGETLEVTGSWITDRAYPQWFGGMPNDSADCSDAINKAILMKQTGQVFISRGKWIVKKSLMVKMGIQLFGEPGWYDPAKPENTGTVITPKIDGTNDAANSLFMGGFIILANTTNGVDWDVAYAIDGVSIKFLHFYNEDQISKIKGIFSIASCSDISCCYWYNFQQAIRFSSNHYLDGKRVSRCVFSLGEHDIHQSESLYAFDFGFLGDALVCEQNMIHDGTYNKGIKLNVCLGGNISSNIINADVLIQGCKGITFNSNHIEGGGQIVILDSSIEIANNFFEKGTVPSVVIETSGYNDTPAVELKGNDFLFYDTPIEVTPRLNVSQISEYDVQIKDPNLSGLGACVLSCSQNYRYWVTAALIGKMYPCGIAICDQNFNVITNFNNYSYMLSSSSLITPDSNIVNTGFIDNTKGIGIYVYGQVNTVTWSAESGKYYYKGRIVWDADRRISGNMSDLGSFTIAKQSGGILINLYGGMVCGWRMMIRLYRGVESKGAVAYTHYVDVPICGTKHLYDNGFSICGFRWKKNDDDPFIGNVDIESFVYHGKNIQCKAYSCPTEGTWQRGDIVYNVGASYPNVMWLYGESSPGSSSNAWKTL